MNLLEVKNLKVHFPVKHGMFSRVRESVKAVDGVSFSIAPGETLGLVGESGCGKTTLGKCILQLIRPTSGEVIFEGRDLCELSDKELVPVRAKLQMIFQDPYDSLDPRFTAADIIGEPLRIHHISKGKEYNDRIAELLDLVGLAPYMGERYPHEISGGQRQRLGIARALALQPNSLCVTSRYPRWMYRFRRRLSTCSMICSKSSEYLTCLSPMTSRWSGTSATAW